MSNGVSESSSKHDSESPKYPKYNRPQKLTAFRALATSGQFLAKLPFPIQALDIGCGVGDTTRLLTCLPNVSRVLGIDTAPDAVAVANCFNDDDRIEYALADPTNFVTWPKPNQQAYELVTAFHSLHLLVDHRSVLTNISRVLTVGGLFIAKMVARKPQMDAGLADFLHQSKYYRQYLSRVAFAVDQPWTTADDPAACYAHILDRSGFAVEHCQVVDEEVDMTEEEATEYLKLSLLRDCGIPSYDYNNFVKQATIAYSKNCKRPDDFHCKWNFEMLHVVARKL